jgi:hypothetical protein
MLRAVLGALGPRARPPPAPGPAPLDLAALAAAARERDYFEVLSLPRSCSADEARQAADRLLAGLDRAPEEVGGLADARRVVLDARDVLGDDARREAYLGALGGPPAGAADPLAPARPEG